MRQCRRNFLIHCLVATLEIFCAGSSESMPLHVIKTSLKTSIWLSAAVIDYTAPFFAARLRPSFFSVSNGKKIH
jgi:hypothetical protein